MADYNPTAQQQTQDPLPLLQDDLLKDRIRQFVEFLDDEVSISCYFDSQFLRRLRAHPIRMTSTFSDASDLQLPTCD